MIIQRLAPAMLVFLVAGAAMGSSTENPVSALQKSDAERIVGIWRITKAQIEGMDGMAAAPVMFQLTRWTFAKDGKLELSVVKVLERGEYKVVEAGKVDLANSAFGDAQGIIRSTATTN